MKVAIRIRPSLHESAFHWLKIPLAFVDWNHQHLIDCNQAFCEAVGLPRPMLQGKTLDVVFGIPIPFSFSPTVEDNTCAQVQRHEITFQPKDERDVAYELELTRFVQNKQSFGILQIRNLTAQNDAEARRRASQERTRTQDEALVEIASDESIHRGDLGEALRTLTHRAAQVLAIDRVGVWQLDTKQNRLHCLCLYDTQLADFSAGQVLEALDSPHYFSMLKNSRPLTLEKALEDPRTRDLTLKYLGPLQLQAMLLNPIRLGEKIIGVLSCEHRREISNWRPSEQAFVAALSDLAALALSAQQHRMMQNQLRHMMKMESVGRLAGGVAHDFNNITQAIRGYTMILLEDKSLSESAQVFLEEMKLAVDMAIKLTRKLLAMSRNQPMKLTPTSLNKVTQNLSGMLTKLLQKTCELRFTLEPNLQEIVVDASMIEQVIINLVVNARDALPEKGGKITVTTRSQSVSDSDSLQSPEAKPGNYVVLSVTDNGSGMDENTMARLFEPFFTTKEEGQGTGLGLSIVYGIVKQHQGWIEVQSKLDSGTAFDVFLPVTPHAGN